MLEVFLQFLASQVLYLALHLESGSFPRPLTPRQEVEAFAALRRGDADARDTIIRHNLRLVAHIVKKYCALPGDAEDLISIGTIGLIKAVDSFDLHKNSRLASYAARCIDNELLMMLRGKKKTSREVSLFEPIGTDREGNEISLLDVMEQEQPDIVEEMEKARCLGQLYGLMETELSLREKEVLTLRYGLSGGREVTQKEIGEKLGISRSYVSRIEKKALGKMRAGFRKLEETQARIRA